MKTNLLQDIRAYINKYVAFEDEDTSTVVALWVVMSYLWYEQFDALPYMVVTSDTKRSGKTRLGIDLMQFVAHAPENFAAMTPAAMFQSLSENRCTVLADEQEKLGGKSAGNSVMQQVLNPGYRRGQTVKRARGSEVVEYDVYGPKVFVLIGDVYDTLRDRSIVVRMKRAAGGAPDFRYRVAETEGQELRDRINDEFMTKVKLSKTVGSGENERTVYWERWEATKPNADKVGNIYMTTEPPRFLTDRDAEIWHPLFAIAAYFGVTGLERIATDMCAEKTADARVLKQLRAADNKVQDDEYAVRLLADVLAVMGTAKQMFTKDIMEGLYAIPTAPWRKYRGMGLNPNDLANTLARFGVRPKNMRQPGAGRSGAVLKGYVRADVERAGPLGE